MLYGIELEGLSSHGRPVQAGVFDENQVRAAAGITMALGAGAFVYAYFGKVYVPIQAVTTLFFVEFLVRVTAGIHRSPLGVVAGWMTRRRAAEWVSAQPKRFAWALGLVLSFAMMVITNSGIRGALPLTICLTCLALMWMESVLGLCLGCEIHALMVRRGLARRDEAFEICSGGACAVHERR
jgi:hypothetical protein